MKRDYNLIRKILIDVEDAEPGQVIQNFTCEGVDQRIIAEHVKLLIDARYLEGEIIRQFGTSAFAYAVTGMTWDGHEFLANAKNDTVWKKVMSDAQKQGGSMSVSVLNTLLSAAAKKYLGLD
jgi:hypothetical protein